MIRLYFQMVEVKTWFSFDTEYSACSVEGKGDLIATGTYQVVKVNEEESLLTVLCDIKYKKAPWGLVKSFIEKNCWAGIEEHYEALTAGPGKLCTHPYTRYYSRAGERNRQQNRSRAGQGYGG